MKSARLEGGGLNPSYRNQPEDKQPPEALSDTRDRIHGIALLVHEHLYDSEDRARIAFARYMDSLAT